MKKYFRKAEPTAAAVACLSLLAALSAHAAPTDGYVQYTSHYKVQNWTTNCGGFADLGGGQYETWVCAGESRVEMRWDDWPNQNTYNQFECDAMFDGNTQNTCIHQIKSNTGGEVIYLQVQSPGTLRNDSSSVFATGMANQWFHINSMFNPVTGDSHAYINGALKVTRSYPTTDRAWYFKNGCYNNGLPAGGKSTAWFKNIKTWVYVTTAPNTPTGLAATVIPGQVALQWNPATGATNYNVKRAAISGGPYTTVTSLPSTNYTDTAVVNGTTYYYVVSATNAFGESGNSTELAVTPVDLGFQLAATPASATTTPGSTTNYTVTMTTNSHFGGSVTFGVTGLPTGASGNFSPASLSAPGTSTLTVPTTVNTPGGSYTLTIFGTNSGFTVSTTSTLVLNGTVANPGVLLWTSKSGTDTNWSTLLNWTNAAAGGFGPPGTNNNVQFTNDGTAGALGTINNVVDSKVAILSLQYGQTSGYHTTLIADGQTLTVGTNVTAGTGTDLGPSGTLSAAITGLSGGLVITNPTCVVIVRQGTDTGTGPWSHRATLDMSGLGVFNANLGRILVAGDGAGSAYNSREVGTLYLARTNVITTSGASPTFNIGENTSNGAGANNDPTQLISYLYLGVTNAIFADSIGIGRAKSGGVMAFNPAFTNGGTPTVYLRGASANRVSSLSVGDESALTTSNQRSIGVVDFGGGTLDAMVDSLYVGRSMSTANSGTGVSGTGTLTYSFGALNVNTLEIGYQTSDSGGPGAMGTVNINGTGFLVANQVIELAHGTVSAPAVQGILNVNGGTVQATNIAGGGGISTVNLNSGTLDLQSTNPAPGQIATVSALNIGAVGVNATALLINAATISASNVIVIAPNGVLSGNPVVTAAGLTVNGSILPGVGGAVGWLTNNGPVMLGAGGHFVVTIQDATAGPAAGWSFLNSSSGIVVQASSASPFFLSLQSPGPAANFSYNTNYDWAVAATGGGITNFASAKFAVDGSQFANDLAGGYFFVRTNAGTLFLSFTNNHPPVATDAAYSYVPGTVLKIPIAALASRWSDPDGDPVMLVSVSSTATNGANNVGTDGLNIYYTNASPGTDAITYVVQDVRTNPPAIYQADDTVQTATGQIQLTPSDFGLTLDPGSPHIEAGDGTNWTVTVIGTNAFAGTVALSLSGLPAGASYNLSPTNVNGSGTSTLTVTTSNGIVAGDYVLTITGSSGSLTHSATVTLSVNDFGVSATPSSQATQVGGSESYTVAVGASNGFGGTVTLSVSGLPAGAGYSLSSTNINGSGASTLMVTTSNGIVTGDYPLTITGTSGSLAHSAAVTLSVNDFGVTAAPALQTLKPGGDTNWTVNVGASNGFSGTVELSLTGLPAGAGYSLDPTNLSGSGASTLSVTTSNATPAGNYLLTITGASGSLTRNTAVTLQVAPLSPPRITRVTRSGTNVVVSGTNGLPGGTYYVLATTNVTWPPANWGSIATNSFDADGNFTFTNTMDANVPGLFYLLQIH